jgi:hypothetical protein
MVYITLGKARTPLREPLQDPSVGQRGLHDKERQCFIYFLTVPFFDSNLQVLDLKRLCSRRLS